jgi:hypothetical protein
MKLSRLFLIAILACPTLLYTQTQYKTKFYPCPDKGA